MESITLSTLMATSLDDNDRITAPEEKLIEKPSRKRKRSISDEPNCQCEICGKLLGTRRTLRNHLLIHSGTKPFACPSCEKHFRIDSALKRHMVNHDKDDKDRPKLFPCDQCEKRFHHRQGLKNHQTTHSSERPFSCPVCSKTFKVESEMKRHQRRHNPQNAVSCPECAKKFKTNSEMKQHSLVHSEDRPKPFQCFECKKNFCTAKSLKDHQRTHSSERPFSCPVCTKTFKVESAMKMHQLLHNSEMPFSCPICAKPFKVESEMKRHHQRHSSERPFSCPVCTKSFKVNREMKRHTVIHNQDRPKPFACEECDKHFYTCRSLKLHQKTWHTIEGMNRKKKQEHRLRTLLKENFIVDEETVIRYRDGCVMNPDKYYARIDFHISDILQVICILECDENSHSGYPISCELSRMEQIHESLLRGGIEKPILFIRYNPNGTVKKDEVKKRISRKAREKVLLQLLKDLRDNKIILDMEKSLQIIYLFYSLEEGIPKICLQPDYSEQMYASINFPLCQ